MTKSEIAARVASETGMSKIEAGRAVNAVIDAIANSLVEGAKVQLGGLGVFKPIVRAARTGRNPHTGAPVDVPEKRDIRFKVGADLKARL